MAKKYLTHKDGNKTVAAIREEYRQQTKARRQRKSIRRVYKEGVLGKLWLTARFPTTTTMEQQDEWRRDMNELARRHGLLSLKETTGPRQAEAAVERNPELCFLHHIVRVE
jgi:hypothetical protein